MSKAAESSKSIPAKPSPRSAISHPCERKAVRLLRQAGWSVGELSMVFEVSSPAIRKILEDNE